MPDVLTVGVDERLACWLEQRLPEIRITAVTQGEDVLCELTRREWALLLVDDQSPAPTASDVLARARQEPRLTKLPIIYALQRNPGSDLSSRLVGQFGVRQLLFHPLDREEVAHQVALALDIVLPPVRREPTAAIAALWERFKEANFRRISVLEAAARALESGSLDPESRQKAEREAHKLAGAVGTFGFARGSALAREIEQLLGPPTSLDPAQASHLSALVGRLRADLETSPAYTATAEPSTVKSGPLILVVDDDQDVAEQISLAAASQRLRVEIAPSLAAAREVIAGQTPDAVLLDLSFPDSTEDGLSLLAELSVKAPTVPVMVLTARDEFTDRVEVARLGGRGFLRKSLPPDHVVEAIIQMMNRLQAKDSKILAVDDDPHVLKALRALLEPRGLEVTTIDDPLRFWEALKETSPDLVMLDVDMPHLSGIELCRVVRNETRWAGLPVLFLTARTDADTIYRIFSAGADDYVPKPIIGPELVTRITNRLERVRLYRSLAETDFLTGVANPRKASQVLDQLMGLATRHGQPMCLSIVDLDHFKQINDRYGHLTGDAVLKRIGDFFLRRFRGSDLVARWGGEEFIVAMYGMSRDDGVQRVDETLELLRHETFSDDAGDHFRVSFSAGVAQFPEDGTELLTLYRCADAALYQAKAAGRGQVRPAGR